MEKIRQSTESIGNAFVRNLYANPKNSRVLVGRLKSIGKLDVNVEIGKQLIKKSSPYTKIFFNTPFPKEYIDLNAHKPNQFTNKLSSELVWTATSLICYKDKLDSFEKLQQAFYQHLLLAEIDKASDILQDVKRIYGVSWWLLEKEFILLHLRNGLEANLAYQNEFNKNYEIAPLVRIIVAFLGMRCEENVSASAYLNECAKLFDQIPSNHSILSYIKRRINPWNCDFDRKHIFCLYSEESSSVIDRLATFKYIIQNLAVFEKEQSEIILSILVKLRKFECVPSLQMVEAYLSQDSNVVIDNASREFIRCLDEYTLGNYAQSYETARRLIKCDPCCVELYQIYVLSLIYLKRSPTPITENNSIANKIVMYLYSIMAESSDSEEASSALKKICYMLGNVEMGLLLLDFLQIRTQVPKVRDNSSLAALNSRIMNPRLSYMFSDNPRAVGYLEKLSQSAGSSPTLELLSAIMRSRNSGVLEPIEVSVPDTRKLFYEANVLSELGDHAKALAKFEQLQEKLESEHHSDIVACRAFEGIVTLLLKLGRKLECIFFVVERLLEKRSLLRRLPLEYLADEANDDIISSSDIRVSIFMALFSRNRLKTYIAYDNYLASQGITRPSKLLNEGISDSKYLPAFLRYVCVMDIMSRSRHFRSTSDLESERIAICRFLVKTLPSESFIFTKEINDIIQKLVIRKGLQHINESKIYVDEKGIRRAFDASLAEGFNRLKEYRAINIPKDFKLVDTRNITIVDFSSDGNPTLRDAQPEDLASGLRIVTTSQLSLFRNQFLDIRDKFVSSNEYGLDSYLSVRIRHGTLQGQIRSIFDKYNILCQRDKTTGTYLHNSFWDARLASYPHAKREKFQAIIASFSEKVDRLTSRLREEFIQVRTENKNPNGLFDYTFTDEEMYLILLKDEELMRSVETYLDAIFEALWTRTRENLTRIRRYIKVEVNESLFTAVSLLIRELRLLFSEGTEAELIQHLTSCLTQLQNFLDRIAAWFDMSHDADLAEFSLGNLADISLESINNVYANHPLQITPIINGTVKFHGRYFAHLADVMRTLLENVINHSGLQSPLKDVSVKIELQNQMLYITVSNLLSKEILKTDPVSRIKERISALKHSPSSDVVRREGGSGYAKLLTILEHGLGRSDSSIDCSYLNNGWIQVSVSMETTGLLI